MRPKLAISLNASPGATARADADTRKYHLSRLIECFAVRTHCALGKKLTFEYVCSRASTIPTPTPAAW